MSATRSRHRRSSRAPGALLAAAALAACSTRAIETHPWFITVTANGVPLSFGSGMVLVVLSGQATRLDATTLAVANAQRIDLDPPEVLGDVTITFDRTAAPTVELPELVDAPCSVLVAADASSVGPRLEPLPFPGFALSRIEAGGALEAVFYLYEATYRRPRSTGAEVRFLLINPDNVLRFLFELSVAEQWTHFEPDECGLVYFDDLLATGIAGIPDVVEPGETKTILTREDDTDTEADESRRWRVHNVASWHRKGTCSDQAPVWTQIAAWLDAT